MTSVMELRSINGVLLTQGRQKAFAVHWKLAFYSRRFQRPESATNVKFSTDLCFDERITSSRYPFLNILAAMSLR